MKPEHRQTWDEFEALTSKWCRKYMPATPKRIKSIKQHSSRIDRRNAKAKIRNYKEF